MAVSKTDAIRKDAKVRILHLPQIGEVMDIKYKKEYERKKWAEDFIKKLQKEFGGKLMSADKSDDPKDKAWVKLLESVPRQKIER